MAIVIDVFMALFGGVLFLAALISVIVATIKLVIHAFKTAKNES